MASLKQEKIFYRKLGYFLLEQFQEIHEMCAETWEMLGSLTDEEIEQSVF